MSNDWEKKKTGSLGPMEPPSGDIRQMRCLGGGSD